MIVTRLEVDNVVYDDAKNISVTKSTGDNNASSTFSAEFNNRDGKKSGTFSVGQTVEVYAEKDSFPDGTGTPLFNGIVESVDFRGTGNNNDETLLISGRDFTARLMDSTVEPSVFANQEVSTIVTSIISSFVQDITVVNVSVTTKIIDSITFNHVPVFDALKQLADLAGFVFYVDQNKDLHFELRNSISSGISLAAGTNVVKADFQTVRREMYNKVWVYGDRSLTGFRNSFTADGGSVYAVNYKPSNTIVLVSGATTPEIGGVLGQVTSLDPGSPFQYLVDFDNKNIIFLSGANTGMHIPTSGTAFTVDAQRSVPIIKYGQDNASIAAFGPSAKVISDKNITDPSQAADLVVTTLNEHASPISQGTLKVEGLFDLTPTNTVLVDEPYHNISNQNFQVLESSFLFNSHNNYLEQVQTVKVNRKILDGADTIKKMLLDIKALQAQDNIAGDVLSRLEFSTGSLGARVDTWSVSTVSVGSSFVLGHPEYGVLGVGGNHILSWSADGYMSWDGDGYMSWGSGAVQPYLGDSRGAAVVVVSGGEL